MTPEQVFQMALWGVVPAILLSFLVYLALWWRPNRPGLSTKVAASGLLGFACVYIVCHALIVGWPTIPPREAMHWLPIVAAIGAGLGCLDLALPVLRTRFASVAIVLVIGLVIPRTVSMTGKAAWLPTALLVWSLLWTSLREVAKAPTRFVPAVVLCLLAACTGASLAGSASVMMGQLAGIIALCAVGAGIVEMIRPGVIFAGPAIGVSAAVLAAALGQSCAYGSTPTGVAMLIAGAGIGASLVCVIGSAKPSSWKRVVAVALVVLAVGGAAVIYAIRSSHVLDE